jgi:hypothetical protein
VRTSGDWLVKRAKEQMISSYTFTESVSRTLPDVALFPGLDTVTVEDEGSPTWRNLHNSRPDHPHIEDSFNDTMQGACNSLAKLIYLNNPREVCSFSPFGPNILGEFVIPKSRSPPPIITTNCRDGYIPPAPVWGAQNIVLALPGPDVRYLSPGEVSIQIIGMCQAMENELQIRYPGKVKALLARTKIIHYGIFRSRDLDWEEVLEGVMENDVEDGVEPVDMDRILHDDDYLSEKVEEFVTRGEAELILEFLFRWRNVLEFRPWKEASRCVGCGQP